MKYIALFFCLCLLCASKCNSDAERSDHIQETNRSEDCTISYYGETVLYFDCSRAWFGNALAAYLKNNPRVTVVALTGDGTGGDGFDRGYWVIIEKK